MVNVAIAAAAVALAAAAELLHLARCRRLAHLAFGLARRPRRWIAAAAVARTAAVGALCWGLLVLLAIGSEPWEPNEEADRLPIHHLVLALDVSPSMQLTDAGPKGELRRAERGRDVVQSILERVNLRRTRISVVAFYTEARPVVVDTVDLNVVHNILDDLPLEYAFTAGKTNLYEGVKAAGELARTWPARSATLVVVSDGDTLPAGNLPQMPAAFAGSLILGVGNPNRGQFIDGHSSRQDIEALRRLALRMGGVYHEANTRHVPSEALAGFNAELPIRDREALGQREWALAAVLLGAVVLAGLSPLLSAAAVRRRRPETAESSLAVPYPTSP